MATTVYCTNGLKLDLNEKPEEVIVSCHGMITEETAEVFQREVRGRTIPESRGKGVATICRIVLDLRKVTHIDSAGRAALLSIRTAGEQKSCEVKVISMGGPAAKFPAMSRLDHLLSKVRTFVTRKIAQN